MFAFVFFFAGWHLPQSCDADEHDAELGADTRHDLDDEGDVDDNDGQTSEDKDSYAMMIRTLELVTYLKIMLSFTNW